MTRTSEKSVVGIPPMAVGACGGIVFVVLVLIVVIWFPWVGDAFGRHKRLVQGVYFTVGFFAFFVERFWHWRYRGAFWQSITALLLFHAVGIYIYSTWVHPLFVWQWMILAIPESFIFVSFLNWSTRRFGRSHKCKTRSSQGETLSSKLIL